LLTGAPIVSNSLRYPFVEIEPLSFHSYSFHPSLGYLLRAYVTLGQPEVQGGKTVVFTTDR
jgi:hypothetical protein